MDTSVQYPNWFKVTGEEPFTRHLLPLAGRQGLRFLQIGVFTGDASVWLLDNVLTDIRSRLVDVDTWQGSAELAHEKFDWADVERFYDERTAEAREYGRLTKWKSTSAEFFPIAAVPFDFIYVDAAHDSRSALADAIGAFRILKPGGILAFDDFNWGTVAAAVNAFAACYGDELIPLEMGAQAWFRRVA